MRLTTLKTAGRETAAVRIGNGYVPIAAINRRFDADWPENLLTLIAQGRLLELKDWFRGLDDTERARLETAGLSAVSALPAPPYRRPRKIWGIGLNYAAHAADLSETSPTTAPASFMKPDTTIIGYGDPIRIPRQSERTTAEAELGVVIGTTCRDVPRKDWLKVVAGFTPIIDMTAEDILRQNPRYLTLSKSFDTFFSFGPELVTPDEINDVAALSVSTCINDRVHAENTVHHMTFPPDHLVAFHSRVMTLLPGDIISTGTPGAAVIRGGDRVECRIDGFAPLVNPVNED